MPAMDNPKIVRCLVATLALGLVGTACSKSRPRPGPGQVHVLQTVTSDGLVVKVEGLAGSNSVSLYSIEIGTAEGEAGPLIESVTCRLFVDTDGNRVFDPDRDRSIGVLSGSGEPHQPWIMGPLIGEHAGGVACVETLCAIQGEVPRRQVFVVAAAITDE